MPNEIVPPALSELADRIWSAHADPDPDLGGIFADRAGYACAVPAASLADHPLVRAGLTIADTIVRYGRGEAGAGREPEYHNRQHFADTLISMAALSRRELDRGTLDRDAIIAGMVSMLAHDYLHDGTVSTAVRSLEAQSYAGIAPILAQEQVAPAQRAMIEAIILATDPVLYARNHAAYRTDGERTPLAILRVLANEADLLASCLPCLGARLGAALGTERQRRGIRDRVDAATPSGRLGFLRFCRMSSDAARELGLIDFRALQIDAYARIADAHGQQGEDAGARILDLLPAMEREHRYTETLSRLLADQLH